MLPQSLYPSPNRKGQNQQTVKTATVAMIPTMTTIIGIPTARKTHAACNPPRPWVGMKWMQARTRIGLGTLRYKVCFCSTSEADPRDLTVRLLQVRRTRRSPPLYKRQRVNFKHRTTFHMQKLSPFLLRTSVPVFATRRHLLLRTL